MKMKKITALIIELAVVVLLVISFFLVKDIINGLPIALRSNDFDQLEQYHTKAILLAVAIGVVITFFALKVAFWSKRRANRQP
ncbi:MAG: hypothetical protein LBQ02_00850 [Candidatus Nomurabacteria bacterium]|jgi:hypothetical protein|nr:hypothetical protein [Candidatus Nomurabacteria bacterium]